MDQVRRDMAALYSLGCPYVLLDTYDDNPEVTRHPEAEERMLATLAEQVLSHAICDLSSPRLSHFMVQSRHAMQLEIWL